MKTMSSLKAEAAQWLFELETSERFEELWPRFQAWLNEDARHREAYRPLEKAWREVASLGGVRPDNEEVDPELLLKMALRCQSSRKNANWMTGVALGAAATVTVAGVLLWNALRWSSYSTPYGVHRTFVLPDHSTMTLNAQSHLIARMTPDERDLELLQGEVFLDAQHDPRRPLKVRVGNNVVQALGTQFSLRRMSEDEFKALVMEGRLEIGSESELTPTAVTGAVAQRPPAEASLTLVAGQAAVIDPEGVHPQSLDPSEINASLLWREGKLSLTGKTLAQAVEEFNRYNQRKLQIEDPDIEELTLGGVYEIANPDGFAEALGPLLGIRCESESPKGSGEGVIHLRRGHR
jgi:transmembrane sensor